MSKPIIATKEWLKDVTDGELLSTDPVIQIVKKGDKKYLLRRLGSCITTKCKARCCKFFHFEGGVSKFMETGFFEKTDRGHICEKVCRHLKRGKCSVWKKKTFPDACKQFPTATDSQYHIVMSKCAFSFEIIGEVKDEVQG